MSYHVRHTSNPLQHLHQKLSLNKSYLEYLLSKKGYDPQTLDWHTSYHP